MARRMSASAAGEIPWLVLPRAEQLRVLTRLMKSHAKMIRALPNVVSVGVGFRTASEDSRSRHQGVSFESIPDQPRLVGDQLCLRVLVSRKRRNLPEAQRIPEFITTRVIYRGRQRRCPVPVDVDTLGEGLTHNGNNTYPDGLVAQGSPLPGVPSVSPAPGAGCCIVRDRDNPGFEYLLGCHHVLALSSKTPGCAPRADARIYRGGELWAFIGMVSQWTTLRPPGSKPGLDAAIALVSREDNVPAWLRDQPPTSVGTSLTPTDPAASIRTPRGRVPARYLGFYPSLPLAYPCGTVVIGPVFEYAAITLPGDSGSPVLAGRTLWGLHFYGTDRGTALSIPARVLFEDDRFMGRTIVLP